MEISFVGKRALVTGASRGFGRGIAIKLAQCGAEVIAVGRSKHDLELLKTQFPAIEIVIADLRDWSATQKALENIGPVNLLVNNAGEGQIKALPDLEEEDLDKILSLNIKGLINVTQIVVRNLLARNASGAIVNISSQASLAGLLHHTVYSASKGAVDAFTRAAALELGPHKIRVNCVNPTVILTDMGKTWWSEPNRATAMISKIPLGRFGQLHELVDTVLFLLSDNASMITGCCLPVDGGFAAC